MRNFIEKRHLDYSNHLINFDLPQMNGVALYGQTSLMPCLRLIASTLIKRQLFCNPKN